MANKKQKTWFRNISHTNAYDLEIMKILAVVVVTVVFTTQLFQLLEAPVEFHVELHSNIDSLNIPIEGLNKLDIDADGQVLIKVRMPLIAYASLGNE